MDSLRNPLAFQGRAAPDRKILEFLHKLPVSRFAGSIYEEAAKCPDCLFISISYGLSRRCPFCGRWEKPEQATVQTKAAEQPNGLQHKAAITFSAIATN